MPFNGDDLKSELPESAPPVNNEVISSQSLTEPAVRNGQDEIELGWLHPSSIFFDILSNGRQNLVPAAIALFSAAKGSMSWLLFAIFIFGISLLHTAFRYFTLRYQIKNGELTVREGLVFKRVRTVPLERIQNIDSTQKVLHRIFNVAEVRVETASGKEPEAVLRVLSLDKIAQLRDTVFRLKTGARQNQVEEEAAEFGSSVADKEPVRDLATHEETLIHEISLPDLIRAGIASNRGILVFGVMVGAYFQFDLEEFVDISKLFDMLPRGIGILETLLIGAYFQFELDQFVDLSELFDSLSQGLGMLETALSVAMLTVLFFVLTRVYGAFWYLLRFYNYQLKLVKNDFRVSCGLFTKVSATVPRRRIQFISIHQSLFMRLFGLSSIRIETAGGAATDNEDATSSMGRRWFIPVIETTKVNAMVAELRPDIEWNPDQAEWMPVSDKTGRRLCRLAVLQSLIFAAVGLAISQPWGWLVGVAVLPVFIYWAIRKSRAMRYVETDFGVAYRSGVFVKKLSLTFYNRIQNIRLDQSPFDRRWKMATLSIDTAAAGPAEHRVHVRYLDEAVARTKYDDLCKKLISLNS